MIMLRSTHERIVKDWRATYGALAKERADIDQVLGNRMVFDHLETRAAKVAFAIETASKVPALEATVARQAAIIEKLSSKVNSEPETPNTTVDKLTQDLADVNAAIKLTQDTPAIVTPSRVKKRNDLNRLFADRQDIENKLQKATAATAEAA
jgi:uncharacterized coiled-coil protein SlyX